MLTSLHLCCCSSFFYETKVVLFTPHDHSCLFVSLCTPTNPFISEISSVVEFVFMYITLHFECWFNQNSLLHCCFLALFTGWVLPAFDPVYSYYLLFMLFYVITEIVCPCKLLVLLHARYLFLISLFFFSHSGNFKINIVTASAFYTEVLNPLTGTLLNSLFH